MKPFRLLVTCSAAWPDAGAPVIGRELLRAWREAKGPLVVVHSTSPTGPDGVIATWVEDMRHLGRPEIRISAERHTADRRAHRLAAVPIRNAKMVAAGADLCLAFLQPGRRPADGLLTETADLLAAAAGIPVRRVLA